ncbi:hypothetical protein L218DRAFT_1008155 [Marasmius fiardii PR-910]|nr:hypothetical protein L218DRAFT_1008155 [Marasmius fiardii PR-910]
MADVTGMTAAASAKLVETLGRWQIISYIDVLSATLLIHELVLNLGVEIEYIWMRKWSAMTVLYILQRYLPLLDTPGIGLYLHFGSNLSVNFCYSLYAISGTFLCIGIVLSESKQRV